jgi:hypothetical protein
MLPVHVIRLVTFGALASLGSSCVVGGVVNSTESETVGEGSTVQTGDGEGDGDGDLPCGADDSVCVPQAPPGWDGPFVLFDGPDAEAPQCPTALPVHTLAAYADLVLPAPANCECTCSLPAGGTCGSVPMHFYPMQQPGTCGGCVSDYWVPPNVCFGNVLACGIDVGSVVVEAAPASGGSCVPSNPGAVIPALEWGRALVGCWGTSPDPGCENDSICLPQAPGFLTGGCVMRPGDLDCPGPAYNDKHLAYLGAQDDRDCNACLCDPALGASCTGGLTFYWDTQCAQVAGVGYLVPLDCLWKSSAAAVAVQLDPPQGGSCAPSGGGPMGNAVAVDPVTICCAPPDP